MPRPVAASTAERIAKIVEAAEQAASAVIDDAEAQARRYLAEAQAEADRVVTERLSSLSELSESLVSQAEAIRGQADRLLASLSDGGSVAPARGPGAGEASDPRRAAAPSSGAPDAPGAGPPQGVEEASSPPGVAPGEPQAPAPPGFTAPGPQRPAAPHLSAVDSGPFASTPPVAAAPDPAPAPPPSAQGDQGSAAAARLLATQMAVSGASREEIDARLRTGFEIEDTASILDAILGAEG